ncbi:30S ribosomal protein S28e [Candidatus Woesearchaeota archaeon]|nr:30S ribosomal protein S28e [Candidatus Woesearchaeota archaeon]
MQKEEKKTVPQKPEQAKDKPKEDNKGVPPKQEGEIKGKVSFVKGFAAEVQEIIGRTGTRGEAVQVRCKILEGRDENKVLRRNIKGPIQIGDILVLRETEFEAKPLNSAGRGRRS